MNRKNADLCTVSFRQKLPGNQVAVMFQDSQKNHVALAKELAAPCLRHQIDALSRDRA